MNAFGAMAIFFCSIIVIGIVGILLIIFVQNKKASDIILAVMVIFSLLLSILSSTAQPENYIFRRIVAYLIAIPSIIGTILMFVNPKYINATKLMVIFSVIGGILGLIFL